MRIAIIGSGYVGLVSGACFSEFGHEVTCVDSDAAKIQMLNQGGIPIYEPGLEDLVRKNTKAQRLFFTTDLAQAIPSAEAVFIAVGTPSKPGEGQADLTFVYEACREVAPFLRDNAVIVTKSTVPVGTNRRIKELVKAERPDLLFHVASNPEFLREGAAIADFMRPDRVVIGCESDFVKELMSRLYRPLYLIETPIVFTNLETSELGKYASNAFLATKITFMNEMANMCEKWDADIHDIAKIMGLDGRIGKKFLHPSPGFGGSCFPKDLRALLSIAEDVDLKMDILSSVVRVNEARKVQMAERIVKHLGIVKEKKLAILGLTFKPNTDDIRESASLVIIDHLLQEGAHIVAYDPQGMKAAQKIFPYIHYADTAYQAVEGADALVVLTEWNEFRALDLKKMRLLMKNCFLFDFRNIFNPKEAEQYGFEYASLGRINTKKTEKKEAA